MNRPTGAIRIRWRGGSFLCCDVFTQHGLAMRSCLDFGLVRFTTIWLREHDTTTRW